MRNKVNLYEVRKDVKCLDCENKGAVQNYGGYYPTGVGDLADRVGIYEKYRDTPHMTRVGGFGGTVPYECLNCGNVGLIDFGGLEGIKKAFKTESE